MTNVLILPVVNINGSGRQSLVDARMDAVAAIRDAIATIRKAWPHGRDYLTHDGVSGDKWLVGATGQYRHRVAALEEVAAEIEAEAVAIYEGGL